MLLSPKSTRLRAASRQQHNHFLLIPSTYWAIRIHSPSF